MTIDEWLKYANTESLALFMYQKPRTAKRLYFDVIPKAVDEYMTYLSKFESQTDEEKVNNPVYFIHYGKLDGIKPCKVSYSMMLNLASVCNPENEDILLDFLERYDNSIDKNNKSLRRLVLGAVNYYYDFIKPNKNYVLPNEEQKQAIVKVLAELKSGKFDKIENQDVEIQNMIYTIGNDAGFELKSWFKCLYQALLGTETGPRMGTFISIYGIDNTIKLIEEKIK